MNKPEQFAHKHRLKISQSHISLPFPCGVVFEDILERQLTHPFGMLGALIFFFPPFICFFLLLFLLSH